MKAPRILLIDDDPDDAFFIRQAFLQLYPHIPFRVIQDEKYAKTYLSGRGRFSDRDRHPIPTHLLLDLNLSHGSGTKVLRWLKGRPELSGLRVAVISGSQLAEDREGVLALGAIDYMVKPIGFARFLALIEGFGEKQGFTRSAEPCPSR